MLTKVHQKVPFPNMKAFSHLGKGWPSFLACCLMLLMLTTLHYYWHLPMREWSNKKAYFRQCKAVKKEKNKFQHLKAHKEGLFHACSFFADADVLIFLAAPPTITLSRAV